jgi:tungstate transport system ATP-binding protein
MDTPGLYEQMTARHYLDFFGQLYDLHATTRRERIGELLAMFDLATRTEEKIGGFSRGMKQKLALARALIHDPPVLFLDEPTASLDPSATRIVEEVIARRAAAGMKVVMTTHDLHQARRLAGEVLFLHRGRLIEQTPAPRFFRDPRSGEARRFLDGGILD